jgi:NTP pyrophosphatase (non-canonical NTP hydrolase)
MESFKLLLSIARRKAQIDTASDNDWFTGAQTYLGELKKEIVEVEEELLLNRRCYLEDELGDVLWDYVNLLLALENEGEVDLESVLGRVCRKYEERVSGLERHEPWEAVKRRQKQRLAAELEGELGGIAQTGN